MLSQFKWWQNNYLDDAESRPRGSTLGPTRKLLETIDHNVLITVFNLF